MITCRRKRVRNDDVTTIGLGNFQRKRKSLIPQQSIITIRICDHYGQETHFRCRLGTSIEDVTKMYAQREGKQEQCIQLLFGGNKLSGWSSLSSVGLKHNDLMFALHDPSQS